MMSKNRITLWVVLVVILSALASSHAYETIRGVTGLIKYDASKAFQGYTLVAPLEARTTYLVDMEG
jgi:hypothetical protein